MLKTTLNRELANFASTIEINTISKNFIIIYLIWSIIISTVSIHLWNYESY